MAFASKDSVLDLASLLEEHHESHNTALDDLEQKVGESAQVSVGADVDDDEDSHEEGNSEPQSSESDSTPRRAIFGNVKSNAILTVSPATVTANLEDDCYKYKEFDPSVALPLTATLAGKSESQNLFSCLFPWAQRNNKVAAIESDPAQAQATPTKKKIPSKKPDENTTSKTEAEKRPSTTSTTVTAKTDNKATGIRKGILKQDFQQGIDRRNSMNASSKHNQQPDGQRRPLFSRTYSSKNTKDESVRHNVQFCPMARCITIDSHSALTPEEKANVWWTKRDYNDFKRTGRLVTKAILQGGSEVWLMTNPSWDSSNDISSVGMEKEKTVDDKWWCKFGHSRRGLEHVTSPLEGQERQRNVKLSIEKVMKEQWRQKKSGLLVRQRLRQVYIRANSWARELALAAAASDAEAVQSNFMEQARDRNYYLRPKSDRENEVPYFMTQHLVDPVTLPQMSVVAIQDKAPANASTYHKQATGFGLDPNVKMSAVMSGMGG